MATHLCVTLSDSYRFARAASSPGRRDHSVVLAFCSACSALSLLIGHTVPHTYPAILRPPYYLLRQPPPHHWLSSVRQRGEEV